VLALVVTSFAAIVGADEPVTAMMRNGERVAGPLEAIGDGWVWIREGGRETGTQRKLPQNQVVVLDFVGSAAGLPETELREARGPGHLLLLRDGSSHKGQLVRVEGGEGAAGVNSKLTFVFRAEKGDERRLATSEIARLYLGNYPGAAPGTATGPPPPASTPPAPGEVVVAANQAWTDAGLVVRKGQRINFSAQGEITLSANPQDKAVSAGSLTGRRAQRAPLPSVLAGALIARIGTTQPFPIGNQPMVAMPGSGRLYLGINDDELGDNTGEFRVKMTPSIAGTGS
jgi:hypothetical protein